MKNLLKDIVKYLLILIATTLFTTVMTSRDLKTRVEKLEDQRNVEAKLLCKVAQRVSAIEKGDALNDACISLIGF